MKAAEETTAAGQTIQIEGSYRTYDHQKQLYEEKPAGMASSPGTGNHEAGAALDTRVNHRQVVAGDSFTNSMKNNGFIWSPRGNNKTEPWHFEYSSFSQQDAATRKNSISNAHAASVGQTYIMTLNRSGRIGIDSPIQFKPMSGFIQSGF